MGPARLARPQTPTDATNGGPRGRECAAEPPVRRPHHPRVLGACVRPSLCGSFFGARRLRSPWRRGRCRAGARHAQGTLGTQQGPWFLSFLVLSWLVTPGPVLPVAQSTPRNRNPQKESPESHDPALAPSRPHLSAYASDTTTRSPSGCRPRVPEMPLTEGAATRPPHRGSSPATPA